ncbi:uncharacterized protein [Rutidosis leptorrhynchoides]|uniref:uncharacterized protein n=1 Tax=Rutidosis leptorrhynchoides TaxID=125765 RepID=UPI003A99A892
MVDAKKAVLAFDKHSSPVKDLVNEFQTNCKKLSKCLPMEAAIATIKAIVPPTIKETCLGGLTGLFTQLLYKETFETLSIPTPSTQQLAHLGDYRPLVQSFVANRNFEHARNFAVVSGVGKSIFCLWKKIRGKEDDDVETCIVSGFGAGVALSLVTGMRGPSVISVGVICALFYGVTFQAEEASKSQPIEIMVDTKKELISDELQTNNCKQSLTTVDAACTGNIVNEACNGGYIDLFTELLYNKTLNFLSLGPPSTEQFARLVEYCPLAESFLAGPSLEHVRNLLVMSGVGATIACISKEIRGKEDVETSIMAGFASGVAISLVTGMRGPSVISVGVLCALVNGGIYKVKMGGINHSHHCSERIHIQIKGEEGKKG